MKNRAQKIRLGIFVVVSATILLLLIGLFTTQRFFMEKDPYFIAYEGVSVSGLEVGSPVKFLGIKVGSVQDIKIDPEDVNQVIVKVALEPDTPIKEDARADITTVGITGLKTIEIRGGTNESDFLKPGDFIPAGSSMTEEITGKAEVIAEKVEAVLNNLQQFTQPENLQKITYMADSITVTAQNITTLVNRAGRFIAELDTFMAANQNDVRKTVLTARQITERLDTTSSLLQASSAKINRIVKSDTIEQILGSAQGITQELEEADLKNLISTVGDIAEQTSDLLVKLDQELGRGSEDFSESMILLRSTLENFNRASRLINNDPSVLLRGTKSRDVADKQLR